MYNVYTYLCLYCVWLSVTYDAFLSIAGAHSPGCNKNTKKTRTVISVTMIRDWVAVLTALWTTWTGRCNAVSVRWQIYSGIAICWWSQILAFPPDDVKQGLLDPIQGNVWSTALRMVSSTMWDLTCFLLGTGYRVSCLVLLSQEGLSAGRLGQLVHLLNTLVSLEVLTEFGLDLYVQSVELAFEEMM
jgi:hypothetical protein